jgi:hypothetical protein
MDSLKFSLISQGYTKITVESAIELANKKLAKEIPIMKEHPEIVYKVVAEPIEMVEETHEVKNNKKGFFSKLFG